MSEPHRLDPEAALKRRRGQRLRVRATAALAMVLCVAVLGWILWINTASAP